MPNRIQHVINHNTFHSLFIKQWVLYSWLFFAHSDILIFLNLSALTQATYISLMILYILKTALCKEDDQCSLNWWPLFGTVLKGVLSSLFSFYGLLFLYFLVWLLIFFCVCFIVWSIYIPLPCVSESWEIFECVCVMFRSELPWFIVLLLPFAFLPEFCVLFLKYCH